MDVATIDSEYQQLEQETEQSGTALQTLAEKLQSAASAGDAKATEWLSDLKAIALQVQQEQGQMQTLLQAIHQFARENVQQAPVQQPGGRAFGGSGFLSGGFGRAMETGAGFGISNMLINSLFGGLGGRL